MGDLYQNKDETGKRDYLYYLAIGNARIKEYQVALKFVRGLLQVEPGNRQAQDLENSIKSKMEKEGLIGMAVVGGATLALGGQINDPSSGKHYSLPFLPATPSSPSRTLKGLFELTRRPSRALDSPRVLLPELQRYKDA